jgi:diacylglycerol kinase family enzyme
MKHVFVVDPKVFRDQQWRMDGLVDGIGQYFRTQEKPNFSIMFSHYPRDAIGLIQKQVSQADMFETVRVYAIGGDDTLFDCLNGIVGLPKMELAIAPYGDTNSFIRIFGEGKAELFKNIDSLAESDTISTDIIEVGNNCAINGCSIGSNSAKAMKKTEIRERMGYGISRLFMGFWFFVNNISSMLDKEIITHYYQITIDDADYSGNYSQILVINSPYFGRNKVALKGAAPDDGLLDVILFKSVGPFRTASSIYGYFHGKIPSNCIRIQAKKIYIKSDTPMWIKTDSEFLRDTSMTFEVVPGAVQVVAVNNLTYQGF